MGIKEIGLDRYYEDDSGTALTNGFVAQAFGFTSRNIMISNDSAATIFVSWNGTDSESILTGEVLSYPYKLTEVYLKGTAGGEEYRIWAV